MKPACLPSRHSPPPKVAWMYNRICKGIGKNAVGLNAIQLKKTTPYELNLNYLNTRGLREDQETPGFLLQTRPGQLQRVPLVKKQLSSASD